MRPAASRGPRPSRAGVRAANAGGASDRGEERGRERVLYAARRVKGREEQKGRGQDGKRAPRDERR